jgi:hypothetical protein
MDEGYVTYQNRAVPKEGFRAFIYAKNGSRMLVNSWDEFIKYVNSNEWFSTESEAKFAIQNENKPELFSIEELKEAEKLTNTVNFEAKRRGRKPKQASK